MDFIIDNWYILLPVGYIIYNEYRLYRNSCDFKNFMVNQLFFVLGFSVGGLCLSNLDLNRFLQIKSKNDVQEEEEDDEDTEEENEENNNNNNSTETTPQTPPQRTQVYEATFSLPELGNPTVFTESLRRQLQTQLGTSFSNLLNTPPRSNRTRFPTSPVNRVRRNTVENENEE